MKRLVLYFSLLLVTLNMFGQKTDPQEAEDWYECFKQYHRVKTPRADSLALQSLDSARTLFRMGNNFERWLFANGDKATLLSSRFQQPYAALDWLDSCAADMKRWRMPSTLSENIEYCYFHLTAAHIAEQDAEDFVRAKNYMEKAYVLFQDSLDGKNHGIAAWLLFHLGNAYVRMGEFESARKVFEEGWEYSYKHNIPKVAKYPDYGGMYVTQEKYEEALAIFQEGLGRKEIPESDEIFNKLSYAECLAKLGRFDQALLENRKVEAQIKEGLKTDGAKGKSPEFMRNLYENYAIIHAGQNEFIEALPWYVLAMKTDLEYDNGSNRQVAYYLLDIGNIYLKINQPDFALLSYHKALETIIPGFSAPANQNPDASSFITENIIYKALEGKARSFEQLDSLDKALESYELIPEVEAKLRATHDYESSTHKALRDSRARIDKAIDIAWRLSDKGQNTRYAQRAFALMEHARAIILMEHLSKSKAIDQLPDYLKVQEHELQTRIAWHEREKAAEKAKKQTMDSIRYKQLDDDLFSLRQKLKELQPALQIYVRKIEDLKYIQAAEVPTLLRSQSALIEYYLSDSNLDVFCVSNTGALFWRREKWTQYWIDQTVFLAQYPTAPNENRGLKNCYIEAAAEMYDLLLKPELSKLPDLESLVIIPDDVLAFLPFEILLEKKAPADAPFANLPYLIRNQSISYAYSATLLNMQQQDRSNQHRDFGAFAPKYRPGCIDRGTKTNLENLDSIQAVALQIQRMFSVADEVPATEKEFKKRAADYAILLLGLHGFVDEEQPELSRLVFGDSIPGQKEDNILHATELEILRLNADLAILLACHTGTGKWHRGEGVYSLARAFALAGVPATLMSLWSLPDNSAPPLMEVYFEKLIAGKTKDEALQAAKLAYLSKDEKFDFAHPYYWAGLMTIGNTKPLYTALHPALLASGIGALLILLGWLVKRYFQNGGQPGAHPSYWKRFTIRRQPVQK